MTIPVEDNEPLRIPIEVSLDRTEETKITITVPPVHLASAES